MRLEAPHLGMLINPSAVGKVCVAAYATCGGSSCGHAQDTVAAEDAREKGAFYRSLGGGARPGPTKIVLQLHEKILLFWCLLQVQI